MRRSRSRLRARRPVRRPVRRRRQRHEGAGRVGEPVQRLPHGGHVDLNLSTDGRVCCWVNSGADVSEVLCELDAVREELQFHLAVARSTRSVASVVRGGEAA